MYLVGNHLNAYPRLGTLIPPSRWPRPVGRRRVLYSVTLAHIPHLGITARHLLIRRTNDTATICRRQRSVQDVFPRTSGGLASALGRVSALLKQTRRRVGFTRSGHVRYLYVKSTSCPSHLRRYSSTPVLLCCGKGTGLGEVHIVGVIKAHRYARCKGSVYHRFLTRLGHFYPSILIIDKLTCNISVGTRHRTLTGKVSAINILTRKLSRVCPQVRHSATMRVISRNKLLARFVDRAGTSGIGFIHHGHVMTNVASTAVMIRSTRGNNTLVATGLTAACRHSMFTFPKQINSHCSVNYGHLVHSGGTSLLRGTRSFMRTVN